MLDAKTYSAKLYSVLSRHLFLGGIKKNHFCDPQLANIIVSGEAIMSAENSGKHLAGRDSAPNPSGELTALPQPPDWWGGACCPCSRSHPRSRLSASIFGPFGPHSAAFPTVFISPMPN